MEVDACCVQLVFGKYDFNFDIFSYVFANLEFTYYVSTMGNLIALGFVILKFGDVVVLK